jgi:hypothetical protein
MIPSGCNNYTHLSGNGTTTLKGGSGGLFGVTVNTKGASGNTLTLYDNTGASGTVIAVIDTTAQVGVLNFGVGFSTGLTAVLATGTAADVTIAWA